MHAYRPGQGTARSRVLYIFRSPPLSQIGRKPLDAEVREALEHTHPDLTFDWIGLLREPMPPPRPDPRERSGRQRPSGRPSGPPQDRPSNGRDSGGRDRSGSSAPPQSAVVIDDDTVLGRALGGAEALRLRTRFAELNQRISRRARTPEERDRLLAAAVMLNPDQWPDEASIRAGRPDIEARWDSLTAELPRRRRGRRGGKNREDGTSAGSDQETPGDVIIGDRDEHEDTDAQPAPTMAIADPDGPAGGNADAGPAGSAEAASQPDAPETDLH